MSVIKARSGIVFIVLFFLSLSVAAEKLEKQNVILIMDASGSMWGQINSRTKIDIARSAISKLLSSWSKATKIGVMAYGHRRKGDCNDIQMLVPVGTVNANQVVSILNDLNPKGKTPLATAIKMAANKLKSKEAAATIILVSDGLETCGMDPCAVATQLKKDNINFRAHVIGFDVNNIGNISQLKCIAKNTGGKFITANNTMELNKALHEVKKIVVQKVVLKTPVIRTVKIGRYDAYQLPGKCKQKRTMFLKSKTKIDGIKDCMKIIIKAGGDLSIDGIISDSIYIVEKGGKLHTAGNQSSVNVYVLAGGEFKNESSWIRKVENNGGKVTNISGSIKLFRMKSGIAIMHKADIDVVEMKSGSFTMHEGRLDSMNAASGIVKLSTDVRVENQSGNASVELIAPKSN